MPRFKLVIEYTGTNTAAGRSRRTPARCRARSIARSAKSRGDASSSSMARAAPTRASTRWRRSRTSSSTPSLPPEPLSRRLNDELPADIHIRGDRQGAAPLSRAARCGLAQLPLSDLAPAHGVRQAVRLVDPRAARSRGHAPRPPRRSSAARTSRLSRTTTPTRNRRWSLVERLEIVEAGALVLDPRAGLALSLEDGAAHRRRAGRRRTRRDEAGRCRRDWLMRAAVDALEPPRPPN